VEGACWCSGPLAQPRGAVGLAAAAQQLQRGPGPHFHLDTGIQTLPTLAKRSSLNMFLVLGVSGVCSEKKSP
jgi:hypothetical protein